MKARKAAELRTAEAEGHAHSLEERLQANGPLSNGHGDAMPMRPRSAEPPAMPGPGQRSPPCCRTLLCGWPCKRISSTENAERLARVKRSSSAFAMACIGLRCRGYAHATLVSRNVSKVPHTGTASISPCEVHVLGAAANLNLPTDGGLRGSDSC